jgi:hypothetical protein
MVELVRPRPLTNSRSDASIGAGLAEIGFASTVIVESC